MPDIPYYSDVTRSARLVTRDRSLLLSCESVQIASSQSDPGNTGHTSEFRPGNVVAKVAATGKYVTAADGTGDRNAVASAIGSTVASVGSLTFVWTYKDGPAQTVTAQAGSTTNTLIAADLNANANFSADLIADVSGGNLRIRSKRAGSQEFFNISATSTTVSSGSGPTLVAGDYQGTDADYRVTLEMGKLTDSQDSDGGTAIDACVLAAQAGHFVLASMINLTAEARVNLQRKGSIFD